MDLSSRERWYDYSRARHLMFKKTDTRFAPWYIVRSDDKRAARLNTLRHVLSAIPYKRLRRARVELPARAKKGRTTTGNRLRSAASSRSTTERQLRVSGEPQSMHETRA
jgi:hypothetical protein